MLNQHQAFINANICLKHFPEQIMFVNQGNPVCRKCIGEHLDEIKKKNKNQSSSQIEEIMKQSAIHLSA